MWHVYLGVIALFCCNIGLAIRNRFNRFVQLQLQSWTKIVGTLAHNCTLLSHPSPFPPTPNFQWCISVNATSKPRHICWLIPTLIRGVGSAKCPRTFGQDCRSSLAAWNFVFNTNWLFLAFHHFELGYSSSISVCSAHVSTTGIL